MTSKWILGFFIFMWLIENFYSKPNNNLIFYVILQRLKNIMKALKRPFPWFTVETLC